MRRLVPTCSLALVLAACGGGSEEPAANVPDDSPRNDPEASAGAGGTANDSDDVDDVDDVDDIGGGGTGAGGTGMDIPTEPAEDPPSLEELAEQPAEEAPWTIVVYGHADHNLSYSLLLDMEEMAAAELGDAVQLVVLADWDSSRTMPNSSPPQRYPEGLQLFRVPGGGADPVLLAQSPEANLDDPVELAVTVRDVFAALPAKRRGIVLWDHGGGWLGGYGGDTQNGTLTSAPMGAELVAEAIQVGLEAANIVESLPLDFVAFDTCLMSGAEVAYPFRDLTDTYFAAAEIDYGNGWDYEATLTHFAENAEAPMVELALAEVGHWDAHHATASVSDALLRSHAALDLSKLEALAAATTTLTGTLLESTTFDPTELGRSAFFALSPYSSKAEGTNEEPRFRDMGQILSALGTAQSDPAVALAARTARDALNDLVLASAQGSLRGGTQAGFHIEQSLARSLTPTYLQEYRRLAGQWIAASRWDELLELTAAVADVDPPVFTHGVINGAGASRAAPPILEFSTSDVSVAKGVTHVAIEIAPGRAQSFGLVGSGLVNANVDNTFAWDGSIIGFAGGQAGMLDVWLDVAPGGQPMYSIEGVLGDSVSGQTFPAFLVIDATAVIADTVVVISGANPATWTTADLVRAVPSATFTPVYLEYGGPAPVRTFGSPMLVPAQGFELFQTFMPAGNYFLFTSLTDIWGNVASDVDAFTLTESLRP